tara:strand:- start:620 stop:802 length:183 start_codon:yes stop_codon:yes gene_type:complete
MSDFLSHFFRWGNSEPVKPKKKPKKKAVVETVKEKPSSDKIQRREEILARLKNRKSDENE